MTNNPTPERVYQDLGNGTSVETPLVKCPATGKVYNMPVKNAAPVSTKAVVAMGLPLQGSNSNSQQEMQSATPLILGEAAQGQPIVARMEANVQNSDRQFFNIILTNTDTNTYETVLGDGLGLIADGLKLPTLNGVVTNEGTWGASTLIMLKNLAALSALDLHELHVTSKAVTVSTPAVPGTNTPGVVSGTTDNDSFFSIGYVRTATGSPVNNPPRTNNVPFVMQTSGDTFRTNIRLNTDFRFMICPYTGLDVKLPPLTQVSISFYINSVNNRYAMGLQF